MVLAFVLMGLILLVTPYVYRQLGIAPPEKDQKTQAAQKTAAGKTGPQTPSVSTAAATAGGAPIIPSAAEPATDTTVAGTVSAASEQ